MLVKGGINGSQGAVLYNEGLLQFVSFQPNTTKLQGPLTGSKKGYVRMVNQITSNGSHFGPNIDMGKYRREPGRNRARKQGL